MNHLENINKNNNLINFLFVFTLGLITVFPNAFRTLKVVLLFLLLFISFALFVNINKKVIHFYLVGVILTFIYIVKGLPEAKQPDESFAQTVLVYVISPFLWLNIANYIFNRYSLHDIIKYSILYLFLGCLTVFMGIWMFDNGYTHLLEYIIENPNKVFTDEGIVEVRLNVYGSFLFLMPAAIQLYSVLEKKWVYFCYVLVAIIAAFSSGRDAVLLSLFVGIAFFVFFNKKYFYKYLFLGIVLSVIVTFILNIWGVNILLILEGFVDKVSAGGDQERVNQFNALIAGINENVWGAGHGVGVDYIRSYKYPWRYEILPLATLYRVGILGLIIYSLPFIYSIIKFVKLRNNNLDNEYDRFFLVGLVSFVLANFTNPYAESFEFQIFYFIPCFYFFYRLNFK